MRSRSSGSQFIQRLRRHKRERRIEVRPFATRVVAAVVGAICVLLLSFGPAASPVFAAPPPLPPGVRIQQNIEYTVDGVPQELDAYMPAASGTGRPGIVIVHGGGWVRGSKRMFAVEAGRLAQLGWVAFSINYRMTGPDLTTVEVRDVQAAINWVRQNAAKFGVDPKKLALLGGSSGGDVALLAGTLGKGSRDTGSRVSVVASWSGPTDLAQIVENPLAGCSGIKCNDRARAAATVQHYVGCAPSACAETYAMASPITHVDPTDPAIFLANSSDEIIPLQQATEMADRLKAAGIPYQLDVIPGTKHAAQYMDQVWSATVAFLERWVGKSRTIGASPSPSPSHMASPGTTPAPRSTQAGHAAHRSNGGLPTSVVAGLIAAALVVVVGAMLGGPLVRRIRFRRSRAY